jgi:hypothetical protein
MYKWVFLYYIVFGFIVLHNIYGKEVYVNSGEIMIIAPPDAISPRGTGSKVLVHDTWLYIREIPKDVIRAIKDET